MPEKILVYLSSKRSEQISEPLQHTDLDIEIRDRAPKSMKDIFILPFQIIWDIFSIAPDLILLGWGSSILSSCVLIGSKVLKVPVVFRVVADVPELYTQRKEYFKSEVMIKEYLGVFIHSLLYNLSMKSAWGYIAVSNDLKEKLVTYYSCPKDRVKVVHVPLRTVNVPDEIQISKNEILTFCTVTNLHYQGKFKGVVEIIDILSKLQPDEIPPFRYHVAGGGEYVTHLMEYVQSLPANLRNQIFIHGYTDDIQNIYDRADIFLYISYLDGYPNSVLEAQASALPVVSNFGFGMKEQIQDGQSGLFIDPSRTEASADVISTLSSSPGLRRKLGVNGLNRVSNENTDEAIGIEFETALNELKRKYE